MAITKVVIPIAGFGTRMFPASKSMPKAMLPILDPHTGLQVPVLQWIIQYTLDSLVKYYVVRERHDEHDLNLHDYYHMFRVCVVLSEQQREMVEGHFLNHDDHHHQNHHHEREVAILKAMAKQITFLVQRSPAGYGDAILCAKEFVGSDSFLVMIGDHVYTSCHEQGWTVVEQMLHAYEGYCEKKSQLESVSPFRSLTSIATCGHDALSINGILRISNDMTERVWEMTESRAKLDRVVAISSTVEKPSPQQAQEHSLALTDEQMERLEIQRSKHTHSRGKTYACYFGVEILSAGIFRRLEVHRKQTVEREKKELTLRDPMRDLMHDTEHEGMLGLIVQGDRHDTGLPLAYAESMHVMLTEYSKRMRENEGKNIIS